MPLVNIYLTKPNTQIEELAEELAEEVANCLSVAARVITTKDVSVRVIECKEGKLLAPVEIDIAARLYEERIKKSDQVCNYLKQFVLSKINGVSDVRVCLVLSEFGHS
jgi:phenylpyruvate tautomerase PptA (4-oxalocrotonate tautomerase family)